MMVIVVISSTPESMKFFAESVNSIKTKSRRNLYLAVCGDMKKNAGIKADLMEKDIEAYRKAIEKKDHLKQLLKISPNR
mgnify:CR=1 FL=1